MTRFTLSDFDSIRRSMKKRLTVYMLTLGAILTAALITGLFLLNQLKSPREEIATSLRFRMEAFESDMKSLWRNVSVMSVHLSNDMTAIVEAHTSSLSSLSGDADAIEQLEEAMLEPLCQYVRQADCSGAFVLLNTSLRSGSHSGLYVQRSNAEHITSALLLYRGMADVGRRHDVMPHRKWAQEFELASFPGVAEHLRTASLPLECSCRTTALLTLPGTSEQAILLTVPMFGADGTLYGLCGFAVNQTYFSAHHVQPSGISRLACVLSDRADGADMAGGLLTYPSGGFCFVPGETLAGTPLHDDLTAFSGTELSFVGLSQPFTAASGDTEPHALTVLIPKQDYDRAMLQSRLEAAALLTLLLCFGVVCCLYYTRRFLRPVLRDIALLNEADCGGRQVTFDELQPVSAKLRCHEQTITDLQGQKEQAEADAKHLALKRRDEIDPEEYQVFLTSYQNLRPESKIVVNAMADGISVQEIADQLGKKVSTVYSYRRDIYEKVGIQGPDKLRRLRVCVALMRQEQERQ